MHGGNAFQISSGDPEKTNRKQAALAALAGALKGQLERHGVDSKAREAVVETVRAEADLLRLMHDGGWPWETVRTEWINYKAMYPDVSRWQRWFKMGSLLPALVMPPRMFYRLREKIAGSSLYAWTRKRWLPSPELTHVKTNWRSGA
jgi:hypothetical protein